MRKIINLLKIVALASPAVLLVQPINQTIINNSLVSKDTKAISNEISSDMGINYNADLTNINSYADYSPIYTDGRTPVVSTTVGTLGMNSAKNIMILTSYNGQIIWANDLTNNTVIKSYYSSLQTPVTDISTYTVKSWQEVYGKDRLMVLFGSPSGENTIAIQMSLKNGDVLLNDSNQPFITNVKDGANFLMATSDINLYYAVKDYFNVIAEVFVDVTKVTITENNLTQETVTNFVVSENRAYRWTIKPYADYFMGWIPGRIGSNVNYLIFYGKEAKRIYISAIDNNLKRVVDGYTGHNWSTGGNIEADNYFFRLLDNADISIPYDETYYNAYNKNFLYAGDRNGYTDEASKKILIVFTYHYNTDGNVGNGIIPFIIKDGDNNKKFDAGMWYTYTGFNFLNSISYDGGRIYYTTKKYKDLTSQTTGEQRIAGVISNYGIASGQTAFTIIYTTLHNARNDDNDTYIAPIKGYSDTNNAGYIYTNYEGTNPQPKVIIGTGAATLNGTATNLQLKFYDAEFHKLINLNEAIANSTLKDKLPSKVTKEEIENLLTAKYAGSTTYEKPKNVTITTTVSADDSKGSLTYNITVTYTNAWNRKTGLTLPNSYTLTDTLTIFKKQSSIAFDVSSFNNVTISDKTATVDLTKGNFQGINKDLTTTQLWSGINTTYKEDILALFNSSGYTFSSFNKAEENDAIGYLKITVNFSLQEGYEGNATESFDVIFNGLKITTTDQSYLNVNQTYIDSNNAVTYETSSTTFTIDLSKGNLEQISKNIYSDYFANNTLKYQTSILKLFEMNLYSYQITTSTYSEYDGTATIKIEFTKNSDASITSTYTLSFINFNPKPYVAVDLEQLDKNDNVKVDNATSEELNLTIDVTTKNYYSITNQLNADQVVSNFDSYQNEIFNLLDYSPNDYVATVNNVADTNTNEVTVDIVFTLKETNAISLKAATKPQTVNVKVIIIGLGTQTTNNTLGLPTSSIFIIVLIVAVVLILLITIAIVAAYKNQKKKYI